MKKLSIKLIPRYIYNNVIRFFDMFKKPDIYFFGDKVKIYKIFSNKPEYGTFLGYSLDKCVVDFGDGVSRYVKRVKPITKGDRISINLYNDCKKGYDNKINFEGVISYIDEEKVMIRGYNKFLFWRHIESFR